MSETQPRRVVCAACGRPATHYTPDGLMCPDDALLSAIRHAGEEDWIPVLLKGHQGLRDRA